MCCVRLPHVLDDDTGRIRPELIPFYAVNTITGAHDTSGYEMVVEIIVLA